MCEFNHGEEPKNSKEMRPLGEKAEEAALAAQRLAAAVYTLGESPSIDAKALTRDYVRLLGELREAALAGLAGESSDSRLPGILVEAADGRDHPDVILSTLLQSLAQDDAIRRSKARVLGEMGHLVATAFGLQPSKQNIALAESSRQSDKKSRARVSTDDHIDVE